MKMFSEKDDRTGLFNLKFQGGDPSFVELCLAFPELLRVPLQHPDFESADRAIGIINEKMKAYQEGDVTLKDVLVAVKAWGPIAFLTGMMIFAAIIGGVSWIVPVALIGAILAIPAIYIVANRRHILKINSIVENLLWPGLFTILMFLGVLAMFTSRAFPWWVPIGYSIASLVCLVMFIIVGRRPRRR